MYGYDTVTGEVQTRTTLEDVPASATVADGILYYGIEGEANLHVADAETGEVLDEYDTGGSTVHTAPVVEDGTVYAAAWDNVYAFDVETGEKEWSFTNPGDEIQGSLSYHDGIIFTNDAQFSSLYAIDVDTGGSLWSVNLDGPAVSTPKVDDGVVYTSSSPGQNDPNMMYGVDVETGDVVLEKQGNLHDVEDGTLYEVDSGTVVALDADDGDQLWQSDDHGIYQVTKHDGVLYASGFGETLYTFDAETGDLEDTREHPGDTVGSPEVIDDVLYYRLTDSHTVVSGNATGIESPSESITISGEIALEDGNPAADNTVAIFTGEGEDPTTVETDSDGGFEAEVPPGDRPYYVGYYQAPETIFGAISIQDVTAEEIEYYEELEGDLPDDVFPRDGSVDMYGIGEVAATEDTDIGSVTVPAGHVVNVTVVDDGDPVEGAPVGYQHADADTGGVAMVITQTDENGTPLFARDGGLELNGEVAVMAASELGEEPNVEPVDVNATEDVVIDLATEDEPRDEVAIEPYFEIEQQIGWQVGDEVEFNASGAMAFDGDEEIEFDSITWDFGDGNTTVIDDPAETRVVTHTYAEGGWYAASAMFEASGEQEPYTRELQVSEPITLTAEPTTAEVNVTEVTFTVEGAENDDHLHGYVWDVTGDGQTEETTDPDEPTYTHTYSELGEFDATVQLQSEMNPAQETVTVDVVDTTDPVARLDAPTEAAVDQTVTADASESTDNHRIADYTWELTDEEGSVVFSDTTDTPVYEFSVDEAGEYELELTVTDESGNTNVTSQSLSIGDDTNLMIDLEADDEQNIRDGVNVDAEVANIGSKTVDEPFAVELVANGTTYDGEFETTTLEKEVDEQLSQDESTTVNFDLSQWTQNHRIVGELDLHVEADPADNISETTRDNNVETTTIEVVYADFNASSHASEVTQGENATLRSYVANAGTATSAETIASVTVTDEDNNTVFENESVTVDALDPGDRQRNRFDESLDPGTYTLTVEVIDDLFPDESETEFDVEPYELVVDENQTSVPSDVNRGQNFTAVFGYETNTNAEVNATLELPEELEFADDDDPEAKTVTDRPRAGITNVVAYDLTAVEASEEPVNLDFSVEDTLELDVEDNTTAQTNISIVTETVTNETAVSYDGTEETVTSTIGVYGDEVSEGHNVSINVQGGPEGRTLQGLEYLVNYPYGCVEQTTSAFLGALNTHQYYEDRDDGDIDPDRQDVINGSIEEGVDRLAPGGIRQQQDDGSWNQWGNSWQSGQSYFSVLALYGLSQVDNDDTYGPANEDRLNDVEFDEAVEWLAEDENWAGTDGYLDDDASAIGFAIISLEEAAESDQTSEESAELIDETYADAADELLEIQDEDSPTWNDANHRSTAFAVYGLQIVLDAEAYEDDEQRQEIEAAVEDGAEWLANNQNEDGSWDPYYQSPWFNNQGDISKSTAIAVLALDATDDTEYNDEIQDGVDYLVDIYETDGSWGYPRATNMALTALTELTNENADRTMNVTLEGSTDVTTEITVDADNPQASEVITDELAQLREENDELNEVTVSVTDSSDNGSGTVIIAVQTTQEVHEDAIGGEN